MVFLPAMDKPPTAWDRLVCSRVVVFLLGVLVGVLATVAILFWMAMTTNWR